MSDVVQTRANDGSLVEFVYKEPMQGGVKDVYFSPDKSYVVAFFRNKLDANGRDRVEKLVNQYRKGIFEQTGGEYWKKIFCWPEKIVEYEGKTGIVVPTYQDCFFFHGGNFDGAEKEGKWFSSAKNFNRFVPPEEKGDLAKFLRVCMLISRGVRRLHAAGLAHSDLSYKNCLVDPRGGNACIIDIDGLVVPGLYPPDVLGTPDFIAPEVVASVGTGELVYPSRATDLHALAVLIYLYLFHRHPLRGSKVWSQDDAVQEKMEMGDKAVFIEDPNDNSNRLAVGKDDNRLLPWIDSNKLPYTIAGPYLVELFNRAFVDGLHNPDARPTAAEWEEALIKTTDLILPCENPNCVKKWFVYTNKLHPACPYCGTPYKQTLPVLDFYVAPNGKKYMAENRRMMIYSGQSLYKWHVDRLISPNEKITSEDSLRQGYFSFYNDKWMLVNERMPDLYNNSTKQAIPINKGVVLTNGLQLLLSSKPSGRFTYVSIVNGK